jgi:hypothetical protein
MGEISPCGPQFFAEFSTPSEFSGGLPEKNLCQSGARTYGYQIELTGYVLSYCATSVILYKVDSILKNTFSKKEICCPL